MTAPRCLPFLLVLVSLAAERRSQDFDADPGWEASRNRILPATPRYTTQKFGYRAGKIGGRVQRSSTPAWYGKAIAPKTLNDKLSASGTFAVTHAEGSSGLLFGWFNKTSQGWRTPNSLAFRLDGERGIFRVYFEYGTKSCLAGGRATFEGRPRANPPFAADGTAHRWALDYDPDGAKGAGEITFTLDGKSWKWALAPGHKADGATFDRFGLWNQQLYGNGMEVTFADLVIDGQPEDLARDPGWAGQGNDVRFVERVARPWHDFGYSRTNHAGGKAGEIGGIVWRTREPAYYADKVGPFTLEDELAASGRLVLRKASSDSAVTFGWFDRASYQTTKEGKGEAVERKNLLGIRLEGPSRIGHYFLPECRTKTGTGGSPDKGPIVRLGVPQRWSLRYDPKAGSGRITFRLDGEEHTFDLTAAQRKAGATFDRFGLLGHHVGDGHFVEVYLDELRYSAGR